MSKLKTKTHLRENAVMRCFSIDDMKKCAEFWNRKPIEQKYFLEFLKTIIK